MAKHSKSYHSTARTRSGALSTFGSRTDIGCVREQNEDSLAVKPPLFVVADGMGGHAAGEVASEICVSTIAKNVPEHPDAEALGHAVEKANRAIIQAAIDGEGREGMGTTCTAAMLENDQLVIAQVGDSRAYLLHAGRLSQVTRDHSLMANMVEAGQITPEEARFHPQRSVITRALGNDPSTRPDLYEINVVAGDRLLLCSDGLSGMLRDEEIEAVMTRVVDPQRCAAQLVNEAIAAGGHDNVTVIVADVQGRSAKMRRKEKRRSVLTIVVVALLFIAIIAGACFGGYTYMHDSAYIANNEGKVAIYKGLPDSILGFSYSELVEVTDVEVANLVAGTQENINKGMRVDSVDAAKELVESYKADIEARQGKAGSAGSAAASAASSAASSSADSASASTDSSQDEDSTEG